MIEDIENSIIENAEDERKEELRKTFKEMAEERSIFLQMIEDFDFDGVGELTMENMLAEAERRNKAKK